MRCILAALLCSFTLAAAQPAPDLSTPKSAARSIYDAVDRGDEAALRAMFHVEHDPHVDLAAAYARLLVQSKRLVDVARQKFPGATATIVQTPISPEDLQRIDEAKVEQRGDTARIVLGHGRDMHFRRVDGDWKLIIAETDEPDEQQLAEQIVLVSELASAIGETADEIAADRHGTPQEAEVAIQAKVNAVLTRTARPGNRPTTAPATLPGE